MKAMTLLYHDVTPAGEWGRSGFPGADADLYKLSVADFEAHLEAIAASGRRADRSVEDWLAAGGRGDGLFLSFDDGGASATATADLLERRGWKGHFFVTTDYIGAQGFLDRAAIRDLHARGHVIGSHSCSHPGRISHLPDAQLTHEWRHSLAVLQDVLGHPVRTASVPGGFYSRRVAGFAAAAGVKALFTSEPQLRCARVGGCLVLGRFGLQQHSPARQARRYADRDPRTLLSEALYWNAKKLVKAAGGTHWLTFRKRWLAR